MIAAMANSLLRGYDKFPERVERPFVPLLNHEQPFGASQ